MGKDLIVESKVVGWDDVDTGILLDLPVSKTEALGLSEELILGDLSAPVVLGGLLQVTVRTHARETEDSSVDVSLVVVPLNNFEIEIEIEGWEKRGKVTYD